MRIVNRRVIHDFQILEKFEAGINLTGPEVKAVKGEHLDLTGSFVKVVGSEIYLVNAKIYAPSYAQSQDYDLARTRKLLLHKKQILALRTKMAQSNLTIVPLTCYTKHGLIKLEIALAKGKKQSDKREELRRKDIDRELERELRRK
ncbi:SsrA-binding protein SmpB [Candidatus Microgenomates bacterium]|nr:SsrA-binding protein SmpB [Candidatus Microgenomates bacterium]